MIKSYFKPYLSVSLQVILLLLSVAISNADDNKIKILESKDGKKCIAGTVNVIRWTSELSEERINIWLWDGQRGQWGSIATNIPANQNSYTWNVPSGLFGTMFRLKVESTNNTKIFDFSNSYFTIVEGNNKIELTSIVQSKEPKILVSPNPAYDKIVVDCITVAKIKEIRLVDIEGRVISTLKTFPAIFNISTLPNNIYLVEVINEDNTSVTHKISVKK